MLTKRHRNENRRVGVTISNTEYRMLKWVLDKVGVGVISTKLTYKKHHAPSYAYSVYSQQALDILSQITPYLQTYKKARASFILKMYKRLTPRNGKYSKNLLVEREKFIKNFFEIKPKEIKLIKTAVG